MSAEQTFEDAQRELEQIVERLERGYAIVRTHEEIVRTASAVSSGDQVEVEVADGRFGARVE